MSADSTGRSSDDRWERLQQLFSRAVELSAAERKAFVDKETGDDAELRTELLELLACDNGGGARTGPLTLALGAALDTTTRDRRKALVGRVVGNYKLVSVLGHGGTGTVYLGERADRQYSAQVAVKIVDSGTMQGELGLRFRAERQILASLNHANIARLHRRRRNRGRQSLPRDGVRARRAARSLLRSAAARAARAAAAVPRHLQRRPVRAPEPGRAPRPEAREHSRDGGRRAEAARLRHRQAPRRRRSRSGDGAHAHERPAAHAGVREPRTDSRPTGDDRAATSMRWASCCTSCSPACARTRCPRRRASWSSNARSASPIRCGRAQRSSARAKAGRWRGSRRFSPSQPRADSRRTNCRSGSVGDIDAIVMRALRKEPQHRYNSIEQLASDVRRFLTREPVQARQGNWLYYSQRFIRRHAFGVAAGAAFIVFIIAFAIAMSVQSQRVAAERDRASRRFPTFMLDIFDASQPQTSLGKEVPARAVLDAAGRRIRADLTQQPEVRARLLEAIGRAYRQLYLPQVAVPYFEDALRLRQGLPDPDGTKTASVLIELAISLRLVDDLPRADRILKQALAISQRAPHRKVETYAKLLIESRPRSIAVWQPDRGTEQLREEHRTRARAGWFAEPGSRGPRCASCRASSCGTTICQPPSGRSRKPCRSSMRPDPAVILTWHSPSTGSARC